MGGMGVAAAIPQVDDVSPAHAGFQRMVACTSGLVGIVAFLGSLLLAIARTHRAVQDQVILARPLPPPATSATVHNRPPSTVPLASAGTCPEIVSTRWTPAGATSLRNKKALFCLANGSNFNYVLLTIANEAESLINTEKCAIAFDLTSVFYLTSPLDSRSA